MDGLLESRRDVATVYVVDDGADYRFLVQQAFSRFLPQYTLALFAGGNALLQHLQTNSVRPSLILLDLHMPGMSGLQTLMRLKQNRLEDDPNRPQMLTASPAPEYPDPADRPPSDSRPTSIPVRSIPVVVVTSSSSAQEIQACYEAGANSCLAKPIGLNPLRESLTLICNYWMDTNRPFLA